VPKTQAVPERPMSQCGARNRKRKMDSPKTTTAMEANEAKYTHTVALGAMAGSMKRRTRNGAAARKSSEAMSRTSPTMTFPASSLR
jgi:hypothetical protein